MQHFLQQQSVQAITSTSLLGVCGSSLSITSSQGAGSLWVALYRITTSRHEPGCSVAGNGLWMSLQCRLLCSNATFVTCRSQSPTLQTVMVRKARRQHFTPPKYADPVIAIFPEGAFPDTAIVFGPPGSSLVTVMFADFGPKLAGWNRSGTSSDPPASTVNGYESTSGTTNSPDDEAMLVIVSVHRPLLLSVSGSSLKDPTQQLPKLPLFAIIRASLGAGATPDTLTVRGPAGSLLTSVMVAPFAPKLAGWKRIAASVDEPGFTSRGAERCGAGNSPEDELMAVTSSGQVPLLLIVSSSSLNEPTHTLPKSPLSAIAVTSVGVPCMPVAVRSTKGAKGSLLLIRIVAISRTPMTVGL